MFKNLSFLILLAVPEVSLCTLAKLKGSNKTIFLRSLSPFFLVNSTISTFSFSVDFTLSTILIPPPVFSTGLYTEESAGLSGTCAATIGAGATYPVGTFRTIPSFTPSESDGFNATSSSCDKWKTLPKL
ncbi:hypothetical protein D9M71_643610 [compost metagenome]